MTLISNRRQLYGRRFGNYYKIINGNRTFKKSLKTLYKKLNNSSNLLHKNDLNNVNIPLIGTTKLNKNKHDAEITGINTILKNPTKVNTRISIKPKLNQLKQSPVKKSRVKKTEFDLIEGSGLRLSTVGKQKLKNLLR